MSWETCLISAGGNDALQQTWILSQPVQSTADALWIFQKAQDEFRDAYRQMLRAVSVAGKPTAVCTVYDAVPGLTPEARLALGLFNEVILREAFLCGIPILDLRLLCTEDSDYSPLSPIEPSHFGGRKIARAIEALLAGYDFSSGRSTVYF